MALWRQNSRVGKASTFHSSISAALASASTSITATCPASSAASLCTKGRSMWQGGHQLAPISITTGRGDAASNARISPPAGWAKDLVLMMGSRQYCGFVAGAPGLVQSVSSFLDRDEIALPGLILDSL